MALFMGFMSIAEKAGGIRFLSRIIGPFFSKIFPEVPKDHPSMGHMVMNFSANLMGLDNAATPFGIKAMESLQEINPDKTRASNAQLMFLCLHASGLTLIPTIIIADRVAMKSANPTDIFIPCMIATFVATIAAMIDSFLPAEDQDISAGHLILDIGNIYCYCCIGLLYKNTGCKRCPVIFNQSEQRNHSPDLFIDCYLEAFIKR